ncbi:MAG: RnfABCDGE type electron transport complex subunit B [Methylocystaceae bacterium]|nr:RnfABCDGE type electron transport complex subunit B [Methylocystaceae bacterium]
MILVKEIDALLPQTQCGECGYPGCLPYAKALAEGCAPIDRCPPGGVSTLERLGDLLKIDPTPYLASVQEKTRRPQLAVIREEECIGCTKCIQACPVDAIVGSAKMMHSVMTHECTGCGLCVEPCPVDCIEMQVIDAPRYLPELARDRYVAHQARILRDEHQKQQDYRQKRQLVLQNEGQQQDAAAKQAYILQALARVKSKGPGLT